MQEPTLQVHGSLSEGKRSSFLDRIVVSSLEDAIQRGDSLALLRPKKNTFKFGHRRKIETEIQEERSKSSQFLAQRSFLDPDVDPLTPCPYDFTATFETSNKKHNFKLGDWETEGMFWRFRRVHGEIGALREMDRTFNDEYPKRGMVLALGNQFRFPKTWLLMGLIRLNLGRQLPLI